MKIVHVEDRFEPEAGYQINEMIKQHMVRDNEIIIFTSDIPIFSEKERLLEKDRELMKKYTNLKIIRQKPLFVISGRYFFKSLFKSIDKLKPDILFLHGIVDFKDLVLLKKRRKYLIFRDCHMSLSGSKNKLNKQIVQFYKIFFSRMASTKYNKVYYLGEEEKDYILKLGINSKIIDSMLHGYDSEEMYFDQTKRTEIRKYYNISEDQILILYTGKRDNEKQPHLIFPIINKIDPKYYGLVKLMFIGNELEVYHEKFIVELKKVNSQIEVIFVDAQPYKELYKFYSASDICIFPKQCTLSSIHAQVCKNVVIMENEKSNFERVYEKKNLFTANDLNEASSILNRNIINKCYNISEQKYLDVLNWLEPRNYKSQMKHIEKTWERLIDEREYTKNSNN